MLANITNTVKNTVKKKLNGDDLVLGPIIGNVTENSARILIESQYTEEFTLTLKSENGSQFPLKKQVEANRPAIFVYHGLENGTKYNILQGSEKQIGSFRTFKDDKKSDLNLVFISCNAIQHTNEQSEDKQLWRSLKQKVQNEEVDYLIHIRDQVYIDYENWNGDKENAYYKCKQILENQSPSEWSKGIEQCRELLREQYRNTWQFEPTQYVLSHAPSTMILDDHEVVDDAGQKAEQLDQNNWEGFYSYNIARYVYYEYQKQLVMDINLEKIDSVTHEYQQFILKNSGFFLMDNRAHYLWHGEKWKKQNSYLGQKQKQALLSSLQDDGKYKDVKSLFFVCSIPAIFLTQFVTRAAEISTDDLQQHWIFNHEQELIEIMDSLRKWQDAKEGRIVTLVGGDINMGGHYDIYYNNKPCFKELITSSISNKQFEKYARIMTKFSAEFQEILPGNYAFESHDFVFANNYGIVQISDDQTGHLVNMNLVSNQQSPSSQEQQFNNRKYVQKLKNTKIGGGSCCTIF